MNKKYLALTTLVLSGLFTSCGLRNDSEEQIDETKTQITVYNFDGGIGTDWLYKVKNMFEEKYATTSFEEGKVGAQIFINPQKTNGYGTLSTFAGSTNDVMFNEYVRYNDYVSQGLFLDISDIVESTADGDTATIGSKLRKEAITSLTAYDGKYYALPHYEVYQGLIYDIDLFDSKKLYFADDQDNGNEGFIIKNTDKKSCGPDGIYNTVDDGLPSSYEEFFKLCDYINTKGCTPIVWTGEYSEYTEYLLNSLVNNYLGQEDAMVNYTLDSNGRKIDIVTDFDSDDNPIIDQIAITSANAYLLKQQPAKYYAIKFLERIMNSSSYYYRDSLYNQTFSHTDAQETFVFSSLENKPIAMLIDGTWWENEATNSGAIERSINTYGDRAKNRNYGFLPLPKKLTGRVNENEGNEPVFEDYINAYCCINAKIDESKIKLAKEFVKFCYSDIGLQTFTVQTGIAKGVTYSLTDEQYEQLSPFAKNAWSIRKNAKIVYPHSANKLFINNERALTSDVWQTTIDSQPYLLTYTAIKDGKKSAKDIFNGMRISKSTWESKYGKWLD